MVMCASKCVKSIDLMLSVLTTKETNKQTKKTPQWNKETQGVVGYVYYLDCGEDIMGICICPNSFNCIHQKCYSLYTNCNSINLILSRVN